jgi:uncharacterized protein YegP (UPF0339 family)
VERAVAYLDEQVKWRWRRVAANGREVGAASQGYSKRKDMVDNYVKTNTDGPWLEGLDGEILFRPDGGY